MIESVRKAMKILTAVADNGGADAAEGNMTTDTVKKEIAVSFAHRFSEFDDEELEKIRQILKGGKT